jgi:PHD/YefM family antitoxin component YafN of YafNO toxin-antitoxin module
METRTLEFMNILVVEEDWNAIRETAYLVSVPGLRESIIEGLATPIEQCEKEPGW